MSQTSKDPLSNDQQKQLFFPIAFNFKPKIPPTYLTILLQGTKWLDRDCKWDEAVGQCRRLCDWLSVAAEDDWVKGGRSINICKVTGCNCRTARDYWLRPVHYNRLRQWSCIAIGKGVVSRNYVVQWLAWKMRAGKILVQWQVSGMGVGNGPKQRLVRGNLVTSVKLLH